MNKLTGMGQLVEVIPFLKLEHLLHLCEYAPFLQHWSDGCTSQQAMQRGLA